MNAVITDDATRRHQHRGELCPDLFDGKTLAQQPLDQFGPLLARYSVEAVEQPRRFDVDASHSANVQRQNDQLVHAFDIATDLAAPPEVLWRHATGVDGVNNELIPLMRMTIPRGLREATLDQLPLGERAGRSWVPLFGPLCCSATPPPAAQRRKRREVDSTTCRRRRTRHPEEPNVAADAFEMPRADLCPGDSLCVPDRVARRFLASTAHGGATAVTRLATFTGLSRRSTRSRGWSGPRYAG
jgi:hypothetical protein